MKLGLTAPWLARYWVVHLPNAVTCIRGGGGIEVRNFSQFFAISRNFLQFFRNFSHLPIF